MRGRTLAVRRRRGHRRLSVPPAARVRYRSGRPVWPRGVRLKQADPFTLSAPIALPPGATAMSSAVAHPRAGRESNRRRRPYRGDTTADLVDRGLSPTALIATTTKRYARAGKVNDRLRDAAGTTTTVGRPAALLLFTPMGSAITR
jgi:hypothetical protein